MAHQEFTVGSALSPAEAFERCIDLTLVSAWDRGVTNPHLVDGAAGEVGAKYEVTVTGFDGAPATVIYTLLEVDAPNRFVIEGVNDEIRAYDVLTFAAKPQGSELHYDAQLELLGDDPPLDHQQLDALFGRIAAVPEAGLRSFLNP